MMHTSSNNLGGYFVDRVRAQHIEKTTSRQQRMIDRQRREAFALGVYRTLQIIIMLSLIVGLAWGMGREF
jgi:polyribonucleotide nucleotidyltransferase